MPSGVPTFAAATGSVNVIAHGTSVGRAVAAAGQQAAEAADDVPERDAGREEVGRRPHGQAVPADQPEPDDQRGDQPAVEHAAGPRRARAVRAAGAVK